jgi:hypothetical protein
VHAWISNLNMFFISSKLKLKLKVKLKLGGISSKLKLKFVQNELMLYIIPMSGERHFNRIIKSGS